MNAAHAESMSTKTKRRAPKRPVEQMDPWERKQRVLRVVTGVVGSAVALALIVSLISIASALPPTVATP